MTMRRVYMTIEEVLETAKAGALQGCTEALFTLGKNLTKMCGTTYSMLIPPMRECGAKLHLLLLLLPLRLPDVSGILLLLPLWGAGCRWPLHMPSLQISCPVWPFLPCLLPDASGILPLLPCGSPLQMVLSHAFLAVCCPVWPFLLSLLPDATSLCYPCQEPVADDPFACLL